MAVAFKRGTTTGPNDLDIVIRNTSNNLIDPFRLEYAVYDRTTGIEVLMGSPVNHPAHVSLGTYYAEVVIPADSNIGDWVIRWTIQETAADVVYQSVQEFNVVGEGLIVSPTGDPNFDKLVWSLRTLLRDNNPDKNYSVAGNEQVELLYGNKKVILSLEELWGIIDDGRKAIL